MVGRSRPLDHWTSCHRQRRLHRRIGDRFAGAVQDHHFGAVAQVVRSTGPHPPRLRLAGRPLRQLGTDGNRRPNATRDSTAGSLGVCFDRRGRRQPRSLVRSDLAEFAGTDRGRRSDSQGRHTFARRRRNRESGASFQHGYLHRAATRRQQWLEQYAVPVQ